MKKLSLLSNFIVISLLVSINLGAPMTEDDEYDDEEMDDPEFPEREAAYQKLKEELEKQQLSFIATSTTTTTSTTTARPRPRPNRFTPNKQKRKWVQTEDVRGYQVFSDGPRIQTELIRTRPMLRIRVNIPDTVHDVEKIYEKRYVELKIRNWNKVHKVHVRVPFGYQPEDLRIIELKNYVDIIAPLYSDVIESDS